MFKILLITHAGKDIGGGHLSRCFALSQGLEELGAKTSWILNDDSKGMARELVLRNVEFVPDPFNAENFHYIKAYDDVDLVVVDSYTADNAFFTSLQKFKLKILTISDFSGGVGEKFSSILVDYSINALEKSYLYEEAPDCRYLLGPEYALLRKDFWHLNSDDLGYVLLIPGASDVAGVGDTVAGWWKAEWPMLKLVCGPLVSKDKELSIRNIAEDKQNISVLRSPENLPVLIAQADVVVCSASVTMYEALALNKKTAIFTVADNQIGADSYLSENNLAYNLGLWSQVAQNSFAEIFSFEPARNSLEHLVNPKGALKCAGEILETLEKCFSGRCSG